MEIYRRTKTSLSEIDPGIIAACHFRIRFDIIEGELDKELKIDAEIYRSVV